MELLFLVIFLLFIALNVVIGLVSNRAKKRRAALRKPSGVNSFGDSGSARQGERTGVSREGKPRGGFPYFLQEQNAENLVQSMYQEVGGQEAKAAIAEVKASLPGKRGAVKEAVSSRKAQELRLVHPRHGPRRLDVQKVERESTRASSSSTWDTTEEEGSPSRGSGWEVLGELPALKRAIILSEILGPPRALSERTHSY